MGVCEWRTGEPRAYLLLPNLRAAVSGIPGASTTPGPQTDATSLSSRFLPHTPRQAHSRSNLALRE